MIVEGLFESREVPSGADDELNLMRRHCPQGTPNSLDALDVPRIESGGGRLVANASANGCDQLRRGDGGVLASLDEKRSVASSSGCAGIIIGREAREDVQQGLTRVAQAQRVILAPSHRDWTSCDRSDSAAREQRQGVEEQCVEKRALADTSISHQAESEFSLNAARSKPCNGGVEAAQRFRGCLGEQRPRVITIPACEDIAPERPSPPLSHDAHGRTLPSGRPVRPEDSSIRITMRRWPDVLHWRLRMMGASAALRNNGAPCRLHARYR